MRGGWRRVSIGRAGAAAGCLLIGEVPTEGWMLEECYVRLNWFTVVFRPIYLRLLVSFIFLHVHPVRSYRFHCVGGSGALVRMLWENLHAL